MNISSQQDQPVLTHTLIENLKEPIKKIDSRFREHVQSENPVIQEMIDYVFAKKGKRLRPTLVFITSTIWDSDNPTALIDLALCIELVHIATLVHDDVIDSSDLRRGIETYNKKWGKTASVLFGDFLFSRAFTILSKLGNLEVIHNLAKTTSEICEGEVMQSLLKDGFNISIEKYIKIIQYKTASLIAESCRIGVTLSRMDKELEEQLYQFGLNIGMAFQIYDDYLDFHGKEEVIGKPILNDLANGYVTLPIIHLLDQASNGNRDQFITEILKGGDNINPQFLKSQLEKYHSLEYTLAAADKHIQNALDQLEKIKNPEIKLYLSEVAQYIIKREF